MFRYTPVFTDLMVDYNEDDKEFARDDRERLFGIRGTTNVCAGEWRKFLRDNGMSSAAESWLTEVTYTNGAPNRHGSKNGSLYKGNHNCSCVYLP